MLLFSDYDMHMQLYIRSFVFFSFGQKGITRKNKNKNKDIKKAKKMKIKEEILFDSDSAV